MLAAAAEKALADLRISFDRERDVTKPCFNCGEAIEPRTLEVVGYWTGPAGNRGDRGAPIRRPLCKKCRPTKEAVSAPFASSEARALEAERSNAALKRTIQSMGEKFNKLVRSISNRALRKRVAELEHVVKRQAEQLGAPWEDRPLPEDKAIYDAFPTRSGSHEAYVEAMRLVGARHSKGALVALVNWLLVELDRARKLSPAVAADVREAYALLERARVYIGLQSAPLPSAGGIFPADVKSRLLTDIVQELENGADLAQERPSEDLLKQMLQADPRGQAVVAALARRAPPSDATTSGEVVVQIGGKVLARVDASHDKSNEEIAQELLTALAGPEAADPYGLDQLRLLERQLREESAGAAREREKHRKATQGVGGVRLAIIRGLHGVAMCRAARTSHWANEVSKLVDKAEDAAEDGGPVR